VFWRELKLVDHKPNKVAIENLFINENENGNTICDFWYSSKQTIPFRDPK
jgi:hypothetical protein